MIDISIILFSEALANYEQRRIPRLKIIQNRSRKGEMRYYETEKEKLERENHEESQEMSLEEYSKWLNNSQL